MVVKTSEYRNSFRPTSDVQVKVYEQNLDFRVNRKSAEFQHSKGAFTWEPQDWDKGSQVSVTEEPRPGAILSHKYKHRLYNKLYNEKQLRHTLESCCLDANPKTSGPHLEAQPPTPPPSPTVDEPMKEKQGLSGVCNQQASTSDQECSTPPGTKSKKPIKPHQKVVSKKTAVHCKTPVSRPQTSATSPRESLTNRAPFVMYGSKDKEILIGGLKTYNIRASTDVYPSALRAKQYRDVQRERKLKSAPLIQKRKPLSFDQLMDKQTSCWQTEYKGHFVGYDKKEYERSISSRLGGRKSVDL